MVNQEEVGPLPLDILGNRIRGFPHGCPLPDELKNEVFGQTAPGRSACRVCQDLGSRTEGYRNECPWLKDMLTAYGEGRRGESGSLERIPLELIPDVNGY